MTETVALSQEEILQNNVGSAVKSAEEIYFMMDEIRLPQEECRTMVFFLDKQQKIHSIDVFENQEFHMLPEKALTKKALQNDISDLIVGTVFGRVPHEKLIHCDPRSGTPLPNTNALLDNERVVASIQLAKKLKEQNIHVRDILLIYSRSCGKYSGSVSREMFPGLGEELYHHSLDNLPTSSAADYEKICENVARHRAGRKQNDVYAVFLDNKNLAVGYCKVPAANRRLIPELSEEKKYLFDLAFKEAVRQNVVSIMLIQHPEPRQGDKFVANGEDCKIFHAAREKSKTFGVPLFDYVLYNNRSLPAPYESYYKYDKHLSFNEFYGMK